MSWIGTWRNQYGSTVEITDEADGVIRGTFVTALDDSGFAGQSVPIYGAASGDCIAFTCAARGRHGGMAVSYTGLLRDGRLETLWHYVGERDPDGAQTPWWRATTTSADTFTRG